MRGRGLVNAAAEAALGIFHERMGRLTLKYGGSGRIFRADKLACLESPGGLPDAVSAFPGPGGWFDSLCAVRSQGAESRGGDRRGPPEP